MAVTCPRCHRENGPSAAFCIHCGAPLISLTADEGRLSQGSSEAPSPFTEKDLAQVVRVLGQLTDRVAALEAAVGATSLSPMTPEAVAAPVSTSLPSPPSSPPVEWAPALEPAPDEPPPSGQPWAPSLEWELVLGLNWFAIIGVTALAIGVGFFLKLSFDNDWIGVTGRIVLGIVSGMALLGVGEFAQRRYPRWAQAVTGGGISILYLSVFASSGFYDLIAPVPALFFLALVVALAGVLAVRYESLVIAILGLGGAFVTPVLLAGTLEPSQRMVLLLYILLVDAGILGVSTFRNWRWFTLVGLVASYALFTVWLRQVPAGDLMLAQGGLTGIFLLFVGATTLFHILWRRQPGPADMALMTLNALAFYGNTFGLLWADYEAWFGMITLSLSLFYGVVAYGAIRRSGTPPQVALFSLATALLFLTVAAPLQLSGSWITVAWAAEGAVLIGVGLILDQRGVRAFGLGVLGVAAVRLVLFDTAIDPQGFTPVLNARFPTFAVAIAAIAAAAYLYHRQRARLEDGREAYVAPALAAVAGLFVLWLSSAEIISYFDGRELAERAATGRYMHQDAINGTLLSLTAMWTAYAMGLLVVAAAKRSVVLRWAGLGLLTVPVLKLLFVDTFLVDLDPRGHRLLLNAAFLTFLLVLAGVLLATAVYRRERDRLFEGEKYVFAALLVAANLAVVWVLSAEAVRFFDAREVVLRASFESAKHLSLTVLWAVYGIAVIAAGIVRPSSSVRLAGISLLGVAVVKLFVFDVFLLEQGYRVAAFVTLGVLLLATGLAYQRFAGAIRGFLFGRAI